MFIVIAALALMLGIMTGAVFLIIRLGKASNRQPSVRQLIEDKVAHLNDLAAQGDDLLQQIDAAGITDPSLEDERATIEFAHSVVKRSTYTEGDETANDKVIVRLSNTVKHATGSVARLQRLVAR